MQWILRPAVPRSAGFCLSRVKSSILSRPTEASISACPPPSPPKWPRSAASALNQQFLVTMIAFPGSGQGRTRRTLTERRASIWVSSISPWTNCTPLTCSHRSVADGRTLGKLYSSISLFIHPSRPISEHFYSSVAICQLFICEYVAYFLLQKYLCVNAQEQSLLCALNMLDLITMC